MSTYIVTADITDTLLTHTALSTALTAKLTLSDSAVVDLAESLGVESTDIETSPVHWILKRWAVAWVGREMCFDLIGLNNVDTPEQEKYRVKYDLYNQQITELTPQITYAVLTGDDPTPQERSRGGLLFRA